MADNFTERQENMAARLGAYVEAINKQMQEKETKESEDKAHGGE